MIVRMPMFGDQADDQENQAEDDHEVSIPLPSWLSSGTSAVARDGWCIHP